MCTFMYREREREREREAWTFPQKVICNKFLYVVIERKDLLFYCGIDIDILERHDILAC